MHRASLLVILLWHNSSGTPLLILNSCLIVRRSINRFAKADERALTQYACWKTELTEISSILLDYASLHALKKIFLFSYLWSFCWYFCQHLLTEVAIGMHFSANHYANVCSRSERSPGRFEQTHLFCADLKHWGDWQVHCHSPYGSWLPAFSSDKAEYYLSTRSVTVNTAIPSSGNISLDPVSLQRGKGCSQGNQAWTMKVIRSNIAVCQKWQLIDTVQDTQKNPIKTPLLKSVPCSCSRRHAKDKPVWSNWWSLSYL